MNRIVLTKRLSWLALAAFAAGCGSGERLYPVTGKVTYKNQPVTAGTVMFCPTEDGRATVGRINGDGTFELAAIAGEHRVAVDARQNEFRGKPESAYTMEELERFSPSEGKVVWLVPERYSHQTTTTLTARVEPGDNKIDLEIKE